MNRKEFLINIRDFIEQEKKKYARIKCLEAIKNTKDKAVDIIEDNSYYTDSITLEINVQDTLRKIQNIPNQDVMPEL